MYVHKCLIKFKFHTLSQYLFKIHTLNQIFIKCKFKKYNSVSLTKQYYVDVQYLHFIEQTIDWIEESASYNNRNNNSNTMPYDTRDQSDLIKINKHDIVNSVKSSSCSFLLYRFFCFLNNKQYYNNTTCGVNKRHNND